MHTTAFFVSHDRKMKNQIASWACSCVFLLIAAGAQAEVEPGNLHDARSHAMGGAGVALIDSGAAVYHNAANLALIDSAVVTLSFSPTFTGTSQPIGVNPADPSDIQNFDTTASLAPLSMIGGAIRLHERVVLGLGAYLFAGTGGVIEDFPLPGGPQDLELQIGIGEVQVPVAVQLTDELSVSAGLRMGFGTFTAARFTPGGLVEQDLAGIGFPGAHVGVNYRPIPELTLGLNYRTPLSLTLSGDVSAMGMTNEGELDFKLPHQLRVGGALRFLDARLTVALDFRASFYEESNDALPNRINGVAVDPIPLNWQNGYAVFLGVEYLLVPELALRAGYLGGNSAVPNDAAAPFLPSPGFIQSLSFGVGAFLGDFELGTSLAYSFSSENIADPPTTGGFPGEYSQRIWSFNLTATYRHPGS